MTTTPTPASQPAPAKIEKLARAVVATYDDPHLSPVAVERAIGMLRKELGEPSPARSDKDADRAPYKALGAHVFGPSSRLFCNTESEERAARLAAKLNDESGRTPAGKAQESACQWPTCQPESVQKEVAAQVHAELYGSEAQESAPSSIDTREFRGLMNVFIDLANAPKRDRQACDKAWNDFIAHIDARRATAGTTAPAIQAYIRGNSGMAKVSAKQIAMLDDGEVIYYRASDVALAGTTAAPSAGQVEKINMAQAGVGEYAHGYVNGYVNGWNDCVDEFERATAGNAAPTEAPEKPE